MKKFISRLPLLKWLFEKKEEEPLSFGYPALTPKSDGSNNTMFKHDMRYPHSISGISELFYDGKNVVDKYGIPAGINSTVDYKNCVAYGYATVVSNPLDQQKFIVEEQCLAITGISDNERQRLENARRFPSRIYIPNGGLSYCYSSASIKKWMKWQERLRKAREAKKLKKENANKKPTS